MVSVLRKGYFLPLTDQVPLTSSPPLLGYTSSHPLFQELRTQLAILLQKQAVEEIHHPSPGFYSRLFLAPKKGGDWRPVIDLSPLNRFLDPPHFKMETTASILQATTPGLWATSIDLKDAFFHIPVATSHRKYLRFMVDGHHYQFRALPFGLATSPYVFTRVMKAVAAYARSLGLQLYLYLDDWILLSSSSALAASWMQWLLDLARALGLLVNIPKCDLTPSQIYHFIGILFDLIRGRAQPTPERIDKFLLLAQNFQRTATTPAVIWQQLLGHMTSLEKLVPRGRLHMRPLQFCLKDQWSSTSQPPTHRVTRSPEATVALQWWTSREHLTQGVPLLQTTPDVRLFTDASTEGWGAHIDHHQTQGIWSDREKLLHINYLELKTVILALQNFQDLVQGHHVIVMSDNTTVVGNVKNQGGTHSRDLLSLTQDLFQWADLHDVILTARHIPGHLNVIADRLSRAHQIIPAEWSLSKAVASRIWKVWGRPHVDLFATSENAKLDTFVSPLEEPTAWRTDALSFSWTPLWAYAFPPIPLLSQVLEKISREHCEVILVAPAWPTQSWFPLLLRLTVDHPRRLPPTARLLRQPGRRNVFHDNPEHLQLHAWKLSSKAWSPRASPKMWLSEFPLPTDHQPVPSTNPDGTSSAVGAGMRGTTWIHSLPLSP